LCHLVTVDRAGAKSTRVRHHDGTTLFTLFSVAAPCQRVQIGSYGALLQSVPLRMATGEGAAPWKIPHSLMSACS